MNKNHQASSSTPAAIAGDTLVRRDSARLSQNLFTWLFSCCFRATSSEDIPNVSRDHHRAHYFDLPERPRNTSSPATNLHRGFSWFSPLQPIPMYRDERLSFICQTLLDEISQSWELRLNTRFQPLIQPLEDELNRLFELVSKKADAPNLDMLCRCLWQLWHDINEYIPQNSSARFRQIAIRVVSLFYEGDLGYFKSSLVNIDNFRSCLSQITNANEQAYRSVADTSHSYTP